MIILFILFRNSITVTFVFWYDDKLSRKHFKNVKDNLFVIVFHFVTIRVTGENGKC